MPPRSLEDLYQLVKSPFSTSLRFVFFLARAPYGAFYYRNTDEPLTLIVRAPDKASYRSHVESFFRKKLSESQYVQVAGALVFAATIACLSWSTPLEHANWSGPALWYAGIILSLTAIVSGAQQAIAIPSTSTATPPVSSHDDVMTSPSHISENFAADFRKRLLRDPDSDVYRDRPFTENMIKDSQDKPRLAMLFVWQMPLMLFAYSAACFFAGLSSVVISPLVAQGGKWGDEAKTVVLYLSVVVATFVAFTSTSWGLYSSLRKADG
ncbi:hypothetical protein ACLMJK_006119 [Lecanora helva]